MNEYEATVEWYWQGKTKRLRKVCPTVPLSTRNPTWGAS